MVQFTSNSKIQVGPASISITDIRALVPICKTGLPEDIPEEMKEAIEALVCLCINPLRGSIV